MGLAGRPTENKIVFDRLVKEGEAIGDFESAIFVMEADGQNPQRLTFEPGQKLRTCLGLQTGTKLPFSHIEMAHRESTRWT